MTRCRHSPNTQHVFGGGRIDLVKQARELVEALGRLSDDRVQEKQDSLQTFEPYTESLGCDHDWLAGVIARHPFGQLAAYAKCPLQNPDKFALVALECGVL